MYQKKKIKITGIIPVKANSERVKQKNLRKFADTTLFELKLSQLSKTKNFDSLYVSSESLKVLNIARKYGFQTHKRDPYYSTSSVPMSEVYKYVASEIEAEHVAWINITNPLAEAKIYDDAVKIYENLYQKFDCLLSAIEVRENFFYKSKPINFKRSPWPSSQDLNPLITLPFVISILKRKNLIKWGSCVGAKPYFYKLDSIVAKDIDNIHDFLFCESVYKEKLFQK
jgi:CMP-N-acetylneuraminic acid synthetase